MSGSSLTLQQLWDAAGFRPNENQERAILHIGGPLYLPAGPGSGKTRVLLWRALNLIVFHDVAPQDLYLSTFTEKAALQLREGLRAYLGSVAHRTGRHYDAGQMYIGTVHSLCRRLIQDRRFYPNRERARAPALLDELKQYFYLYRRANWEELTAGLALDGDANTTINSYFGRYASQSRHLAVTHCIALFNRLSEECVDPREARRHTCDDTLKALLEMYAGYLGLLQGDGRAALIDLSLLQQSALDVVRQTAPQSGAVFRHVIIDEYQDTNTVQERIFFALAASHKNLCVVGDDDQALYRFRGATVENFVEFPDRCASHLQVEPATIPLNTNYRSRAQIVRFYTDFIGRHDWRKRTPRRGAYRVAEKDIQPHRADRAVSVVASAPGKSEAAGVEIAGLVRRMIDDKKVEDPNQIAFLFPSLKSVHVKRLMSALEARGLRVYAPRAGSFLDVAESVDVFGVYLHVFGKPDNGFSRGREYENYCEWIERAWARGKQLMRQDKRLAEFVAHLRQETDTAVSDYQALSQVVERRGWDIKAGYDIQSMKRKLVEAAGLSDRARSALGSVRFERIAIQREKDGQPFTLEYIIRRATALDWSVLDLFYRLCGFDHFKRMFDLAESGEDEGPICNLGLISQYLALFIDEYASVITANLLAEGTFRRMLFASYLFALYRRGESEYEDAEDPFPRGRIPFLTIHQAKGLEFPVVVLGNPYKSTNGPQRIEKIVHPLLQRESEPLERQPGFDAMRLFYVALSRAQNLLVIAHLQGQGIRPCEPMKSMLENGVARIADLDMRTVPLAQPEKDRLPGSYSYTGDYLQYRKCPRQYMIFRKYGFVPSRSQMMMFGNLVHRTMDDLHQLLIAQRSRS